MNFIAGSLLHHCDEVMAFWLFVGLLEECELRDLYLPGFPGLQKHSQMLFILIREKFDDLYQHFVSLPTSTLKCDHKICVEMFASTWILTIFATDIPLEKMSYFYDRFFARRWVFFYELMLSILKYLE